MTAVRSQTRRGGRSPYKHQRAGCCSFVDEVYRSTAACNTQPRTATGQNLELRRVSPLGRQQAASDNGETRAFYITTNAATNTNVPARRQFGPSAPSQTDDRATKTRFHSSLCVGRHVSGKRVENFSESNASMRSLALGTRTDRRRL